jgi:glycosyltransferase involved in cell wall biosynthesis
MELGDAWFQRKLISDKAKIHEVMEVSSTFSPLPKQPTRKLLGLGNEKIYLWIGRLDKNKDPETLVNAFAKFANEKGTVKLFIAFQSNELLEKIKKDIANVTDKIQLLGKLNRDQLTQWYSAADFIISTSHYEGSGLAVCEAMSCGCVPIVTSIPSFRMMTDSGRVGMLFEPGNSKSLVDALERSLTFNIENGRQQLLHRFENHLSFPAIAKKIEDVIQDHSTVK